MKKGTVMLISFAVTLLILLLTGSLAYIKGKNAGLANARTTTQTNQPPVVVATNAPVAVQTNAPTVNQVDLLAAEVKALKAANEEREARVKRLIALNEEVRREREMATNVITVPVTVTVNVTNSPPAVPTNKTATPVKKTKVTKGQAPRTRTPMYVVTNTTSSVTTTGTNVSSVVNTQTQSFLKPQRRWSLMGLVFGEKDPIPTTVPSGQSVQQGYPAPQVVVVEQPAYGYGYPYGYGGYRSPYQPVYSGYGSSERRLFGVRFHAR